MGVRDAGREREARRTPNPLRRLEVRLPEDHPIFSFPDGTRTKVAAAWLDLAHLFTERIASLEGRLASVESRLAALEEALGRLEGGALARETGKGQEPVGSFDAAGFFSSFE